MKSSLPKVSVSWKLIFLALFGLYCFSRLYNLVLLPITNDEANYILWAKYTATTNSGWFISLESGKPPIFFWLIVFFIKMLPSSAYLVAGRLASVFSGFLALFGIFKLANLLFRSTRAGFISMILYILCPFTLMYNRLALYDSLLTTTMLWAVYFALRAAKTQKNLAVAGWGISLGLALLVKPTALVFFVLTPIIYLLTVYDRRFLHKLKTYSWQIVLALLIAVGMHSFLVLSSGFYDYITRALDYTSKGSSDLATRLAVIGQNLNFTTDWLAGYLTWPLVLLCLVSLVYLWRKNWHSAFSLFILWFTTLAAFTILARIYFPRYFLFAVPYLLLPVAYFLGKDWKISAVGKLFLVAIIVAIFLPIIRYDWLILVSPEYAPLPEIESWQYVTGYPSSTGFDPVYHYLDDQLQKTPVTLFVFGSMSHYPNAFVLRYWGNPRIQIMERLPLLAFDSEMERAKKTSAAFIVYGLGSRNPNLPDLLRLPLHTVVTGKKPLSNDDVILASY